MFCPYKTLYSLSPTHGGTIIIIMRKKPEYVCRKPLPLYTKQDVFQPGKQHNVTPNTLQMVNIWIVSFL